MTTQEIGVYNNSPNYFPTSASTEFSRLDTCQQTSFSARTVAVRKFIELFERAIEGLVPTKTALEEIARFTDATFVRIQFGDPSDPDLDVALNTENFDLIGSKKAALTLRQPLTFRDHKPVGEIVISRNLSASAFQAGDRAYLKEIAKCLAPSFLLSRSLKRQYRNFYLSQISGTEPACIVTFTGLFRDRNEPFDTFAKSTNLFGPRTDRLLFRSNQLQNAVLITLQEFQSAGRKRSFNIRHDDNQLTFVEMHQIGRPSSDSITPNEVLLVFRTQTQSISLNRALAIDLFHLTPAEADVAASLFEGMRPNAIANLRGVAVSTIRSLLKSINSKLSVTSQLEAVAKLREHCQISLSLDFYHSDYDGYL